MNFTAFIGLKDEVELIETCINQLRAIGADSIIVLDAESQDGSREVVEQLAAADKTIHLAQLYLDLSRDGPIFGPDWKGSIQTGCCFAMPTNLFYRGQIASENGLNWTAPIKSNCNGSTCHLPQDTKRSKRTSTMNVCNIFHL